MPVASVEQLVGFARAHQNQLLAIRDQARATIVLLWARIVVDPTDTTAEQWIGRSVPVVETAQRTASSLALNYVSAYVAAATGTARLTPELSAADFLSPRGVSLTDVLFRPIVSLRTALANGEQLATAITNGGARAAQIAATDPMLSARAASSASMQAEPRVVGFRRVPDGGACKFCVLVSTQRYHDSDLMAIHPGCGCTVAPIIGSRDPGRVLDRGLVDQLMTADPSLGRRGDSRTTAREIAAADLAKANDLTAVHQHGELGPTLYPADVNFAAAP